MKVFLLSTPRDLSVVMVTLRVSLKDLEASQILFMPFPGIETALIICDLFALLLLAKKYFEVLPNETPQASNIEVLFMCLVVTGTASYILT
jgi:hypothetical protein